MKTSKLPQVPGILPAMDDWQAQFSDGNIFVKDSWSKARATAVENDPYFIARCMEGIVKSIGALVTSQRWISHVRPTLLRRLAHVEIQEIVCYSLGHLEDANVSFQIAFLLLVANELKIPILRRLVFDPSHTDDDRRVLALCGCNPLLADENARRKVASPTLFYMPFAPFHLTDNVVRANWDQLHRIAIIGNAAILWG
jgi:hypothetical protein